MSSRRVQNVVIVGGTHGNERHGVVLAKHFQSNPASLQRPSLQTTVLISNTLAVEPAFGMMGRRYVDTDMNRCFSLQELANPASQFEQNRAKEINALLGPKGAPNPATDFVIDLHNSTANTGVLICLNPRDRVALAVAGALHHAKHNNVHIALWSDPDPPFLPSVGTSGFTLEVGAVAHGTVNATLLLKTAETISAVLDLLNAHNSLTPEQQAQEIDLEVFDRVCAVDFPRNDHGDLTAFIHPNLQGINELMPDSSIKLGDPLFVQLDGTCICLQRHMLPETGHFGPESRFFPMFVNEAAYYEKGVAMMLTMPKILKVPFIPFQ